MGRKIFVSYKYWDSDVLPISDISKYAFPKVRDYVTWLEKKFNERTDHIYKGEYDDEDLSDKNEEYIWRALKDKIYDSTVTIVLISRGMKEYGKWEKNQWIPWEISYSLRETTRNDYTSHSNAVLAVVLPNRYGNYKYYNDWNIFGILKENIEIGYIPVVRWDDFIYDCDTWIERSITAKSKTPAYKVVKTV